MKGSSWGRGDLEGSIASLRAFDKTSSNAFGLVSKGLASTTFLGSSILVGLTSCLTTSEVDFTSFFSSLVLWIISKPFSAVLVYSPSEIWTS